MTLDDGARSVVRGGYGRFYEKTHFELIGGIFNGGVFSNSFTVNFPTAVPTPARATASCRPIRSWSTVRP